jgi:preprotein translocase subunit SecE
MAEEFETASEDVVEKAKADRSAQGNVFARIVLFFKQVIIELKKVTRPTYKELLNYTWVVLGFVVVIMVIITFLDWLFLNAVTFTFAG